MGAGHGRGLIRQHGGRPRSASSPHPCRLPRSRSRSAAGSARRRRWPLPVPTPPPPEAATIASEPVVLGHRRCGRWSASPGRSVCARTHGSPPPAPRTGPAFRVAAARRMPEPEQGGGHHNGEREEERTERRRHPAVARARSEGAPKRKEFGPTRCDKVTGGDSGPIGAWGAPIGVRDAPVHCTAVRSAPGHTVPGQPRRHRRATRWNLRNGRAAAGIDSDIYYGSDTQDAGRGSAGFGRGAWSSYP